MGIRRLIRKAARRFGYQPVNSTTLMDALARRRQLMTTFGVDLVIDVGANAGQYGVQLRKELQYTGRLESFEPLTTAFSALQAQAAGDPRWRVHRLGLGDRSGRHKINVANNSYSSSLLPMLPAHEAAAPDSRYVTVEEIEVTTLDAVFASLAPTGRRIMLKIDTQGYELHVLQGALQCLESIDTLQLELSLVPLYDGELLYDKICEWLAERRYSLVSIEPGFSDSKTGRLLQFDGIFHRY